MGHTLRTLVKWFHGSKRFNFTGSWSALIGDAARVGYFVPLNGQINGHPPSFYYLQIPSLSIHEWLQTFEYIIGRCMPFVLSACLSVSVVGLGRSKRSIVDLDEHSHSTKPSLEAKH